MHLNSKQCMKRTLVCTVPIDACIRGQSSPCVYAQTRYNWTKYNYQFDKKWWVNNKINHYI